MMFLAVMILFSCCSKPYGKVKNKVWEGQIYRSRDDKELSDVVLKMGDDTLLVYANAIFGAGNDTLLQAGYDEKDSVFTFRNQKGENFQFKLVVEPDSKNPGLYFVGPDYYMVLRESSINLNDKYALSFYRDMDVPRDANMYLDGAYEGEVEMENQFSDLFLAGIGGISVKIVFIDHFKLKIYIKSLLVDMFSGSAKPQYEIVDYKILGNKLIFQHNKSKAKNIEVRNNGETLVLATDKMNVVMHKIY